MSIFRFLIVASVLSTPVIAAAVESNGQAPSAVEEINGYPAAAQSVKGLKVHYPAGRWTVTTKEIDERRSMIQLQAKSASPIVLSVFITRETEGPDAHYLNHPNFVNTAVLLPIVLDIANKDESRIYFSIGTANLPDYWDASTRAIVLMEDQRAIHFEACHQLDEPSGSMVSALVSTQTKAGQVLEDPDYCERVTEAYQIIQNLMIGR